jgi:hypothetical protein
MMQRIFGYVSGWTAQCQRQGTGRALISYPTFRKSHEICFIVDSAGSRPWVERL